jgi:outer membrane murein-binding lipoprotein Lpp
MKTNQLLIALAIFAALLIAGCAPRTRVGALRNESQLVELGDAETPIVNRS